MLAEHVAVFNFKCLADLVRHGHYYACFMEDTGTAIELGRIIGGIVVFFMVIGFPILFIIALIQSFVN